MVKNPPAGSGHAGDSGFTPGWEDALEEGMQPAPVMLPGRRPGGGHAARSSDVAWRIPWREEPGGLQSMGSQSRTRVSDLHPRKSERGPPSRRQGNVSTLTLSPRIPGGALGRGARVCAPFALPALRSKRFVS